MNSPYDLVGAVLPQALRLARYQALATLPQDISDLQKENETINQAPSREEERILVHNANIMIALEDLFSFWNKDRTCKTSKLTRVESVRFQRGMYRIWLMSILFGPRRFVPRPTGSNDEYLRNRDPQLGKSWADQKSFLKQFSSKELLEINALVRFLVFISHWAVSAEGTGLGGTRDVYDWNGMFLFAGPHIILRCREEATTAHLPTEYIDDDGPYTKFIQKALSEVIEERQVAVPPGYLAVILDKINGERDRCRHCGGTAIPRIRQLRMLPDLYNETNWDDLKGRLDWEFLIPQNLTCNLTERPLPQALKGDWSTLIHEMFACKPDEYAKWSEADWICTDCWSSFFWDTMWRWRLAQKRMDGKVIGEDCRYGYDCKEQCFEKGLAHAKQFNHLCKRVEETSALRLRA